MAREAALRAGQSNCGETTPTPEEQRRYRSESQSTLTCKTRQLDCMGTDSVTTLDLFGLERSCTCQRGVIEAWSSLPSLINHHDDPQINVLARRLEAAGIGASSLRRNMMRMRPSTDQWIGPSSPQSPYHSNPTQYPVFRNVKDYDAKGDGVTDDTDAINLAISTGGRTGGGGPGMDSSTIAPALVYFPSGIYRVTKPIISYYYTSLVGDATNRPTLKADPSFQGLAVIDENPYLAGGANWYTNQNNFFRSTSHFIVDLTQVVECSGIHHQVAQATTLRDVHFEMPLGNNRCKGIFMENGSGGHLTG